ncbi:MAG TPA: ABC transporter permease [Candidatus Saccharimonadales bacterium]|nr:ABC transporter permease [Candidatus Saccharimonadales bacterium]
MAKTSWIQDVTSDMRYAARTLAKNPGFAAVAVLTLALGIGANTAIFSVVDATLLKPLPIREPQNVMALWETEPAPGSYPLAGPDFTDWRSQNSTFEDMSMYSWPGRKNLSAGEAAQAATVVATQANFFHLLGVQPQLGRAFADGEDGNSGGVDAAGGARVAVLSDGFWKKNFAGNKEIVGATLELDGEVYTVVGVMPAWFRQPGKADLWVPTNMKNKNMSARGEHWFRAIGRLKPGVSPKQAQADLHVISARLAKEFPDNNRGVDAIVQPIREMIVGDFGNQLLFLFGSVALVLLIACANVANLLLARATGRRREMAVRNALGAGAARMARQMLTESLLLSVVGGVVGVGVAFAAVEVLRNALPASVPQPNALSVGIVPLLFTLGVSVVVGVLFGMVPALQATKVDVGEALRPKATGGSATKGGHWLRDGLVVAEIALSLALLIGAGLLLKTFANLRGTDVGVRGEHVLTARINLPANRYQTMDESATFVEQLLARLQNSPGVRGAGAVAQMPLNGGSNGYIKVPGVQMEEMTGPLVEFNTASEGYFHMMGIPLLAGRDLNAQDTDESKKFMRDIAPAKTEAETRAVVKKYVLAAVISKTMAAEFWPKQDPLGKTFEHFSAFQVVGVVGDVKQFGLTEKPISEAYFATPLNFGEKGPSIGIVVKGDGAPESLTGALRSAMKAQDPGLALFEAKSMAQHIEEASSQTQYEAALLGTMAMLALLLAAVGTYGVMSYVVGQRTNEIGIRMALGAGPGQIMAMVLRQAGTIVGIGIVVGLAGAAGGSRLLEGLLVGVKAFDKATYAEVAGLLAAVALLACYLPVRRAMRVDPMVALRDE